MKTTETEALGETGDLGADQSDRVVDQVATWLMADGEWWPPAEP
jgi:hypothetical protein